MCVRHKYLWLGRPERKPISFYRNKEPVNTSHLPGKSWSAEIYLERGHLKISYLFHKSLSTNVQADSETFLRDGVGNIYY